MSWVPHFNRIHFPNNMETHLNKQLPISSTWFLSQTELQLKWKHRCTCTYSLPRNVQQWRVNEAKCRESIRPFIFFWKPILFSFFKLTTPFKKGVHCVCLLWTLKSSVLQSSPTLTAVCSFLSWLEAHICSRFLVIHQPSHKQQIHHFKLSRVFYVSVDRCKVWTALQSLWGTEHVSWMESSQRDIRGTQDTARLVKYRI